MNIPEAVTTLTQAWKDDPDFRYAYQANIAMAFVDECHQYRKQTGEQYLSRQNLHDIANRAADNFLTLVSK